jgi:hypothetical protein
VEHARHQWFTRPSSAVNADDDIEKRDGEHVPPGFFEIGSN